MTYIEPLEDYSGSDIDIEAAADAAETELRSLDVKRQDSSCKIVLHCRHSKRGYVGTVVIEETGASQHKVRFSPATFRAAVEAAERVLSSE